MIDFKAFFISSQYISSLSKHVKHTLWSDINCNKSVLMPQLQFQFPISWITILINLFPLKLTSLLFSIHYIMQKKKKSPSKCYV